MNRIGHPILIYEAASEVMKIINKSAIPEREKQSWYGRVQDAVDVLMEGVKPTIDSDGVYFFPSKPGKARQPGEKNGHHVKGRECDCKASEYGNICWARAAKAIAERVLKMEPIAIDDSDLFDEPEEPYVPLGEAA